MQSDLCSKYLLWLALEGTSESRIRQWWEKRAVRHGHGEMRRIPMNGRLPIKGHTLLPAYPHLSPWKVLELQLFFTFFSVYHVILFLCPLPPISNICVWVKAGHNGTDILFPHDLLFMCVNVLFYWCTFAREMLGSAPGSLISLFHLDTFQTWKG